MSKLLTENIDTLNGIATALICATYKQVHAQEQKKVEAVK